MSAPTRCSGACAGEPDCAGCEAVGDGWLLLLSLVLLVLVVVGVAWLVPS